MAGSARFNANQSIWTINMAMADAAMTRYSDRENRTSMLPAEAMRACISSRAPQQAERQMNSMRAFRGAMWTGNVGHVARVALLVLAQRHLAVEAEHGVRLAKFGVHADAPIKDKAFALEMRAAAFFEIFQNAAIKLKHF